MMYSRFLSTKKDCTHVNNFSLDSNYNNIFFFHQHRYGIMFSHIQQKPMAEKTNQTVSGLTVVVVVALDETYLFRQHQ